jgi:hypothetical protein
MPTAWENWKKNQGDSRPWHLLDADARITDQAIVDKRYDLCKSCEHFIKATTQCTKCGCIMKAKTTLKIAECPIGKWGREDDVQSQ